MTFMATETSTEYAVKATEGKHGKWQVTIEPVPGHENDREWTQRIVEERREWQAGAGLTPDAELVFRVRTGADWSDWLTLARRPEDATTTAELQDALNPFTFWRYSTPELAEQHHRVLAAAGKRPTPDGSQRTRIYAALNKSGKPIAWVVGDCSRVIPFDKARALLLSNWADLVRERPHGIPEW